MILNTSSFLKFSGNWELFRLPELNIYLYPFILCKNDPKLVLISLRIWLTGILQYSRLCYLKLPVHVKYKVFIVLVKTVEWRNETKNYRISPLQKVLF